MSSDIGILLLAFFFYFCSLALLSKNVRNRSIWINFLISFIYSFYFIYGMFYRGQGGAVLGWFLYFLAAVVLHSLINIIISVVYYRNRL